MNTNDSSNDDNNSNNTSGTNDTNGSTPTLADQELIANIVNEKVSEQLKDIKTKLDNAYSARDAALKKAEELSEAQRAAELKKLEEEGKHKEVYEMKLIEKDDAYNKLLTKVQEIEAANLQLTRDNMVRDQLSAVEFKNERAYAMAFHEIIGQVVKDEKGNWVHRSGVSVKDFIQSFISDDTNSFLMKAKPSSGGGNPPPGLPSTSSKSLFSMSQAEVLKLAAAKLK
jgi:hypothetical protein